MTADTPFDPVAARKLAEEALADVRSGDIHFDYDDVVTDLARALLDAVNCLDSFADNNRRLSARVHAVERADVLAAQLAALQEQHDRLCKRLAHMFMLQEAGQPRIVTLAGFQALDVPATVVPREEADGA